MGRKTKLNPELHERIVSYVKAGAYIETAAAAAGISKVTLYDWLKRGAREQQGPFHDFARDIEDAQAQDEIRSVVGIERIAGAPSTRSVPCPSCKAPVSVQLPTAVQLNALTWKLERKYPERYGNRLRLDHEGQLRTGVEATLEAARPFMRQESYADFVQALAQALGLPRVGGTSER